MTRQRRFGRLKKLPWLGAWLFLLWAAPPFFEGMRNGAAAIYGLTLSDSVVDISALVFVIFFMVGCLMRFWKTSLVISGLALVIWAS